MKMNNYWVYTITTPNNMVYVGYSGKKYTQLRWNKTQYKSTYLQPYIDKFGWENLHFFFIDGLKTKEEAKDLEDELILMYRELGCCINKQRSGFISKKEEKREQLREQIRESQKIYYDKIKNKEEFKEKRRIYREEHKEYFKKWCEEHKEYMREKKRQYRERKKQQKTT